jgi:anti-sigma regulatory factor (Ser/Thr protein kinase)
MENHRIQVSLKTYLDRNFLPMVISFVENSAMVFGLGTEDVLKLTLACEEIFAYLCQVGQIDETIDVEVSNGRYFAQVKFLFKAHDFNPRAFNLTTSVSLDDQASLEEMGLLIASRSADRFTITGSPQQGLELVLIKEKSYPGLTELKMPEVKPIKNFLVKTPDAEEIKFFCHLILGYYSTPFYPPSFRFPGKIVDMIGSGEYQAAVAMDSGGQLGGGIIWRWAGGKLVEFFGPYCFNQLPVSGMAERLIDTCIGQIAKTDAISLISRYTISKLPEGYFELLGSLDLMQPDGTMKSSPVFYRQLHEDLGCKVWAHPDLEGFLRTEYGRLFFAREIRLIQPEGEMRSPYSVFTAQFDRFHHQVALRPILEGTDAFNNLSQHVRVIKAEGLMGIFFEIDLGLAWQATLTPSLLGNGFRPRLILPYGGEADLVVFQYQEGR